MSAEAPFRILTVCTGNVCRSPLAERLLQSGFDEAAPGQFTVSSAGTRALVGDPAQPLSEDIAARLGSSLEGFRARQVTPDLVEEADLILVLAEAHRARVLGLAPSALKRTFTLREFARILELLPGPSPRETVVEAWRRLVADGHAVRHEARVENSALNDVTDPYGLGPKAYERMAEELVPAASALIRAAVPRKRGRRTGTPGRRSAVRTPEAPEAPEAPEERQAQRGGLQPAERLPR